MVATEVVVIPLKEAPDFGFDNEYARASASMGELLAKQPGFIRSRTGVCIERPTEVVSFVDWDNVSDHVNFTKTPEYAQVGAIMGPLTSSPPTYVHYQFHPPPALQKALSAPVIELATVYYDVQDDAAVQRLAAFGGRTKGVEGGAQAVAFGWSEEEVEHEAWGKKKGKALKLVLGWESVEQHHAFTEKDVYKENAAMLKEGVVGHDALHVRMRQG